MRDPGPAGDPAWVSELGPRWSALRPADPGYSAYTADVVMEGHPDLVIRPRDAQEVREIVAFAGGHGIPLTAAGGRTSVTGSSVTEGGILLPLENLGRLLDLSRDPGTGGMTAVVEPGMLLGDFQRELETRGWFYPPDPTSRNEAQVGATVATNATGEDTLLYGPTRRWVRGLRVVTADGRVRELRRPPASRPPEEKATAGYYRARDEIDLLIGSEGTLGVITGITVDVIPTPPGLLTGLAFFPTALAALEFVVAARETAGVVPRALEFIDRPSLDEVGRNPEGITWPADTGGAVVFKQEFRDEAARDRGLAAWRALLSRFTTADLLDEVLIAADRGSQERLRSFRHRVPASINERIAGYREHGGGKVATDWWVPHRKLPAFLEGWRRRIEAAGLEARVFGHVGNGHPHVNFMARDAGERARAQELVVAMCREAVGLGGGVAGEHGLGKLKRHLLSIQYSRERIREMVDIKRRWDPGWILGRGNLFPVDPS